MSNEIDALVPGVVSFKLSGGLDVELEELRLRQFLKLIKIVTDGTPGGALVDGLASLADDSGEFGANLLVLVTLGVPNAEDAVVNFVKSMVRPAGLVGGINGKPRSKMTKQEIERDENACGALESELANPHLEDVLDIIERTFVNSASDFKSLGKKLKKMFDVAKKTGMV